MKLTEEQITKLEEKGFKRWQKPGIDRLYINASTLGLECDYYNTGNIKYAEFCGEHISNCHARKLKAAKTYINVETGKLFGTEQLLINKAQEIIDEVIGTEEEE